MNGESTYTNSFYVEVQEDGFLFVPRTPAGYWIDDELYQKNSLSQMPVFIPRYTILKQNSVYFMQLDIEDIHTQRALFFSWFKGISERLIVSNLTECASTTKENQLPIMKNLTIDYRKITSLLIAENSGSGKPYFLTYILEILNIMSTLIIIDPKFDSPSSWA